MSPRPTPLWLVGPALLGTVAVGLALRWSLAGVALPPWLGRWDHLRGAHSHLGYFGVLFPLAWHLWSKMGLRSPGVGWLGLYAIAVAASFVGFATQGYALVSIAGSTVVLVAWIVSTAPLARLGTTRDWLASAAPSVWLASVAIPGVAVLSSRDDPMATPLVRAFLTWLLLGVTVSTALRWLSVPAPPPWLHLPLVLGAGLALGPLPHPVTWAALGGYGLLVSAAALRMTAPLALRGAWVVLGAGLVAVALGRLGQDHLVAIAGLHFAVLGPVLGSASWPRAWARWLPAYLATVAGFATAILGPLLWPWSGWGTLAAALGTALAAVWSLRVARVMGTRGEE